MFHSITHCRVCRNTKFAYITTVCSDAFDATIYRCEKCGLFFQNPMPSETFLAEFYNNIYKKEYAFVSTEHAFEQKDRKQEQQRIRAMEKYVTKGSILDVGASTGFFLSELQKRKGWELYGVEYSKLAVEAAKKSFGIAMIHGDIHNKKIPDNFFDVVTMHSVLEHIPEIDKTVSAVHKKLKNGGYYIFNVPNMRSFEYWFFSLLGKQFPGFIVEHLYYFTPAVLRMLMKKHGFTIVAITSRQYSTVHLPPKRPLSGWLTYLPKLFLEYTDFGGKLCYGNVLYIYAQKTG